MVAQPNPNDVNARRFVALVAGCDTGNACEAEALSKFRALRRMAVDANMRIVDVLELPEVRKALDDQLQPARAESPALQDAQDEATALREELTERTRDVRNLADRLRQQEETTEALRQELTAKNSTKRTRQSTCSPYTPAPIRASSASHSFGAQSWLFETAAIVMVGVLLVAAICNGYFLERSKDDELGSDKRSAAPVVRKGGSVLSVPKSGALRHRLPGGGASPGTR